MTQTTTTTTSSSSSLGWDSTEGISAYFVMFATLLALVLILSKLLQDVPRIATFVPEAGMILLVGMIAGFFVNLVDNNEVVAPDNAQNDDSEEFQSLTVAQTLLSFSPQVFFVALLPPIIFNSGYHLRRELFFRHLGPIVAFAVVGTMISAVTITFFLFFCHQFGFWEDEFTPTFTELLTFGALLSATDPVSTLAVFQTKKVDPHLFYLVFGESVLNDAVGLILFNTFRNFVEKDNGAGKVVIGVGEFIFGFLFDSVGSPILGIFCGCLAALLFKHIDMRNSRLLELSVYILIMYVPFLLADIMELSGIVTILFCGMTARAYVVPNLSRDTASNAEIFFRLFAHLAETSIFLELGLSVFGLRGSYHFRFILLSLLACLIGRILNVYPITFLYNQRLQTQPRSASERVSERHSQTPKGFYVKAGDEEDHFEMTDHSSDHSRRGAAGKNGEYPSIDTRPSCESTMTEQTLTPRVRRDLKIPSNTAHMLCFSGLRGAVAYACVRSFPDTFGHQTEFTVATMVIVLVTVFALGGTTGAVLNLLRIDMNVNEDGYMEQWHQERQSSTILLRIDDALQRNFVRQECPVVLTDHAPSSPNNATMAYDNGERTESATAISDSGEPPRSPLRQQSSLFDFGK